MHGFEGFWGVMWDATKQGARKGVIEGWGSFMSPARPRFWRYIAREARQGWKAGLKAYLKAYELCIEGRLDAQGRVRPAA